MSLHYLLDHPRIINDVCSKSNIEIIMRLLNLKGSNQPFYMPKKVSIGSIFANMNTNNYAMTTSAHCFHSIEPFKVVF